MHAIIVSTKARCSADSVWLAHALLNYQCTDQCKSRIFSPARFYVSVVMKMILSHLILNYDIKLADPTARPFLTLGKTRLPRPFMTILVRRRSVRLGDH